jgi:hypothetical protein
VTLEEASDTCKASLTCTYLTDPESSSWTPNADIRKPRENARVIQAVLVWDEMKGLESKPFNKSDTSFTAADCRELSFPKLNPANPFLVQEADREHRAQNESLRAKLEQERELLVEAQEQGRRLQARVEEERAAVVTMQAQLEGGGKELREKEKALQQERVRIETIVPSVDGTQ